eukprot:comp6157_c0_seq1/m.1985 comp6157_c0_seq1/g.1985  ORF comp6157_c0_seq1/g.1985 comp6157_c0_seq1/m.1985 type:complete len:222 (-) comp6157_c0_seq1:141-806(-)
MAQKKLSILVLHGGYQSKDMFYKKTGSLRKLIKNYADLSYVCATHVATEEEMAKRGITIAPEDLPVYRWWSVSDGQWRDSKTYLGMDETMDVIKRAFREQGPFDGVLGFSQGGVLAAMLCGLNAPIPTPDNPISFRFAIIAAAFPPTGEPYRQLLEEKVNELVPTLHVFGENDVVVNCEASETLASLFPTATVWKHPGGHTVPANAEAKAVYAKFLAQFQK